jgi:hypothetical protein
MGEELLYIVSVCNHSTLEPLLTHTPRWTPVAMGYWRLYTGYELKEVAAGAKRQLSTKCVGQKKSWVNRLGYISMKEIRSKLFECCRRGT